MLLLCMVTAFLVCTLMVCFVAVIMFSPLVRGGENEWSTSTAEDNLDSAVGGNATGNKQLVQIATKIARILKSILKSTSSAAIRF